MFIGTRFLGLFPDRVLWAEVGVVAEVAAPIAATHLDWLAEAAGWLACPAISAAGQAWGGGAG